MRVLMLVWTGVATDTRVLREAGALVAAGYEVHIIGRAVPDDFHPPPGITVDSVGAAPRSEGRTRPLSKPERMARWLLLPNHIDRRLRGWSAQAREQAQRWAHRHGPADVVHAHDFTTLELAHELATAWRCPLVYDSHEYWRGRPTEGRPAPVRARRAARREDVVGGAATAVITVGEEIATALRRDHPNWPTIHVVRNSFPSRTDPLPVVSPPAAAVYAGRLARDRELETIAAASELTDLPITLMGPGDESYLEHFDPRRCALVPSGSIADVDAALTAAGIALVTHSDAWENHRLALPNKLFHALSLGVPVVATDVGALAATVRAHDCGVLYAPGDAAGLAAALDQVRAAHAHYQAQAVRAGAATDWSRDRDVLLGVYAGLSLRQRGQRSHGAGPTDSAGPVDAAPAGSPTDESESGSD